GGAAAGAGRVGPPADPQAIATVIGRRRCEQHPADQWLNLHGATLPGVEWREAHLERANLSGAHLEQAHLSDANLEGADLIGAHLERAHLRERTRSGRGPAGWPWKTGDAGGRTGEARARRS